MEGRAVPPRSLSLATPGSRLTKRDDPPAAPHSAVCAKTSTSSNTETRPPIAMYCGRCRPIPDQCLPQVDRRSHSEAGRVACYPRPTRITARRPATVPTQSISPTQPNTFTFLPSPSPRFNFLAISDGILVSCSNLITKIIFVAAG